METEPEKDGEETSEEEPERSGSFVSDDASRDPVVVRTARNVRRVGYTVALIGIIYMVVPVTIGIISGISNNEIIDPYTDRAVADRNLPRHRSDCRGWGLDLLEARARGELDESARVDWWSRCGESSLWIPSLDNELSILRARLSAPEDEAGSR